MLPPGPIYLSALTVSEIVCSLPGYPLSIADPSQQACRQNNPDASHIAVLSLLDVSKSPSNMNRSDRDVPSADSRREWAAMTRIRSR